MSEASKLCVVTANDHPVVRFGKAAIFGVRHFLASWWVLPIGDPVTNWYVINVRRR